MVLFAAFAFVLISVVSHHGHSISLPTILRYPIGDYSGSLEAGDDVESAQESIDEVYDNGRHPIDDLTANAKPVFEQLLKQKTVGVEAAAAAYRQRRGRHPPPSFDKWVRFAEGRDALMVESFFDRMHQDLEPFWSIPPDVIRGQTVSWPNVITIRNGQVRRMKLSEGFPHWLSRWQDIIESIPNWDLPDVDLAFNPDDEPHVFVPWESVAEHLRVAKATRHTKLPDAMNPIIDKFSRYEPIPDGSRVSLGFEDDLAKEDSDPWDMARAACPPTSPARKLSKDMDPSLRPEFPPLGRQTYTKHGYIRNFTESKSPCSNPALRNIHGYFVYPKETTFLAPNRDDLWGTRLITQNLFPLLTGCKIEGVNNEILVPGAMNWVLKDDLHKDFEFKEAQLQTWDEKTDTVAWRGVASGGFATAENFRRFHRYRLVSMLNASQVQMETARPANSEVGADRPADFPLPDPSVYRLSTTLSGLAGWIQSIASAVFTLVPLGCWPPGAPASACTFANSLYKVGPIVPMLEIFKSRYLPDVDGGSYSGRFRSYLTSNSLPLKATIWAEWHDSRLVPWQHFVPMDNSMGDMWGILDYFIGQGMSDELSRKRSEVGRSIAHQGREWAERVLRREDMEVWMYRLILELARLGDEQRHRMGYVKDLLGPNA